MSTPLLQATGVQSFYGQSQVIFGIDLHINPGETIGLLGRNGMGKTTLIKSLLGLKSIQSGKINFNGQGINGLRPDKIARLGLAVVPEGRQVFPNLTVLEHLTAFTAKRNEAHIQWDAQSVFELFPRLKERQSNLGSQLSGGEQQMLAIGRALVTNPKLLILDEATEGLAPLIREEIWSCLKLLRQRGQSLIVVDKYVNRLVEIADRHLILERGQVAWSGSSSELSANTSLWSRYLGV
jgi:branched-chain amino acid transport system ATP-binding protein